MHANHTIANATITGMIHHMLHLPSLLTGATPGQRQEDETMISEWYVAAFRLRALALAGQEPHG